MVMIRTSENTIQCDINASELKDFGLTPAMVVDGDSRAEEFLSRLNEENAAFL